MRPRQCALPRDRLQGSAPSPARPAPRRTPPGCSTVSQSHVAFRREPSRAPPRVRDVSRRPATSRHAPGSASIPGASTMFGKPMRVFLPTLGHRHSCTAQGLRTGMCDSRRLHHFSRLIHIRAVSDLKNPLRAARKSRHLGGTSRRRFRIALATTPRPIGGRRPGTPREAHRHP